MQNDTWEIKWKEQLAESYAYGSEITFLEDGSIRYKNPLMPPGTVVHKWFSKTVYQGHRIEPTLPLIDGESPYMLVTGIDNNSPDSGDLMLRIVFYDRYDEVADSMIIREKKAIFRPSIRTYSYTIELINGGNADFTFRSLVLREISKEEFDADQKRIARLKEEASKGEKRRKKNKKSKRRRAGRSD